MNNTKKQILGITLGIILCCGIANTILGMEKYKEFTEGGASMSLTRGRELLAALFTKCWSELDIIFVHDKQSSMSGPFFKTLKAIQTGTVTEQVKKDVLVYWGNLYNQQNQMFKNKNYVAIATLTDECLYKLLNDLSNDEVAVIRALIKRETSKSF